MVVTGSQVKGSQLCMKEPASCMASQCLTLGWKLDATVGSSLSTHWSSRLPFIIRGDQAERGGPRSLEDSRWDAAARAHHPRVAGQGTGRVCWEHTRKSTAPASILVLEWNVEIPVKVGASVEELIT